MKNKILTILIMIILCVALFALTGCSNKGDEVQDVNNTDENEYIGGNFKTQKIEKEKFASDYTVVISQTEKINTEFFILEPQAENFAINIVESDRNKGLIEQGDKINCNEKYDIKNASIRDIIRTFYGGEGQDLMYPLVFLLSIDGTVKGIDIEAGYKTGEFIAYTIPELKDVVTIEQVDVHPADDSGYTAVVAITKDEEIYEIRRES